MTDLILLSTAYLPPVQYMTRFVRHGSVLIEAEENFLKQTYRNRAVILTANGPEALVMPVVKGKNTKQRIKDLELSYDTPWQHVHWQAIVSAYQSSPFFELLQDDFLPFYQKKYRFLLDYNDHLLRVILNLLEIDTPVGFTEAFEAIPAGAQNLREAIHPKPQKAETDPTFTPVCYPQVFNDRFEFIPNLSIIDLIFNCGPESYEILAKSGGVTLPRG